MPPPVRARRAGLCHGFAFRAKSEYARPIVAGTWARATAGCIRIAHRGASADFPENTLRAFEEALALGVDAIELDCQLSADGELVVIHDETLERTTDGIGPVCAHTWEELRRLDAGRWKDDRFRGVGVPRLGDVLELVADRALINVELKSFEDVGRIERPVTALVQRHGATDRVVFSSFHTEVVRGVRAVAGWARLGILCQRAPVSAAMALAEELGAGCVVPRRKLIDARVVDEAHRRGLGVWVWTVNDRVDMRRLRALGVDAMFSDYPARFADV